MSSEFTGASPEAYERLLLDVMAGDHTLFVSAASSSRSHGSSFGRSSTCGTPIRRSRFSNMPAGSMGPEAADKLLRGGRARMAQRVGRTV